MDIKHERTKILSRIKVLKYLHKVDDEGYVILNEKNRLPSWIDCKSCKFAPVENSKEFYCWPQDCLERKKAIANNIEYSISVTWGNTNGWICLIHKFKNE